MAMGLFLYKPGFMGTLLNNVKLTEMFALVCTIATLNF